MLTDQKQKNNSAPASEDTSSTGSLSPPPNIKFLPLTKDKSCRDELSHSYIAARQEPGVVFHFDTPLPCRELIGTGGRTQKALPLPIGKNIGEQCSTGLPDKCTSPKLHSIRYSSEDKGFWVTFSATNGKGETKEAQVLLLEGESGEAAVVTLHEYKLQKVRNKLIDGYKEAKEAKEHKVFHFSTPLPCSELIGVNGYTQCSLPLPNEKNTNIGANVSTGLPTKCTSPELLLSRSPFFEHIVLNQ